MEKKDRISQKQIEKPVLKIQVEKHLKNTMRENDDLLKELAEL